MMVVFMNKVIIKASINRLMFVSRVFPIGFDDVFIVIRLYHKPRQGHRWDVMDFKVIFSPH